MASVSRVYWFWREKRQDGDGAERVAGNFTARWGYGGPQRAPRAGLHTRHSREFTNIVKDIEQFRHLIILYSCPGL